MLACLGERVVAVIKELKQDLVRLATPAQNPKIRKYRRGKSRR